MAGAGAIQVDRHGALRAPRGHKNEITGAGDLRFHHATAAAIRLRKFSSGNRPIPARMLSRRWVTLEVAGIATVIAGWDTTNFSSSC